MCPERGWCHRDHGPRNLLFSHVITSLDTHTLFSLCLSPPPALPPLSLSHLITSVMHKVTYRIFLFFLYMYYALGLSLTWYRLWHWLSHNSECVFIFWCCAWLFGLCYYIDADDFLTVTSLCPLAQSYRVRLPSQCVIACLPICLPNSRVLKPLVLQRHCVGAVLSGRGFHVLRNLCMFAFVFSVHVLPCAEGLGEGRDCAWVNSHKNNVSVCVCLSLYGPVPGSQLECYSSLQSDSLSDERSHAYVTLQRLHLFLCTQPDWLIWLRLHWQ